MKIDKPVSEAGEASPIEFRLDPSSGVPTYLQIVQQVERALRLGYLVVGDRLLKVKKVVASLALNPNTVLKDYRDLEHKGLAAGRPGQGTFIEATLDVAPLPDQQALQRGLSRWLNEAAEAGMDEEGIAALFASALHDLRRQGSLAGDLAMSLCPSRPEQARRLKSDRSHASCPTRHLTGGSSRAPAAQT